ncbi:cellulose synthase [Nocardioides sp. JQ2195]|uniref:cellulose synthase n=1 Tax=Nocardioides sp. JQ2195 TaxID=2592334 RepID=UPI00143ED18E|nr:cellulose synthase [Nocardioides sp. JQ2195]QIX27557.1 cellulose synthase [Nocardioides sp. JQ2195]
MSDVSWLALALALTVCGGLWTWYAARNRGVASGVRGAGITLLPFAAYFTGTLEMAGEIGSAVADWATGFVFSPFVWVGLGLFVLSVVLFGVSGRMGGRTAGETDERPASRKSRRARKQLPPPSSKGGPVIDDDLSDIEAILKKRGIS